MPHLYLQGASLICANPFFRPACFSDHFCEYSFKHDRLHSVPSKLFSVLIFILFFFIIIAAKRRHLMSKLPKEHFAQNSYKRTGFIHMEQRDIKQCIDLSKSR